MRCLLVLLSSCISFILLYRIFRKYSYHTIFRNKLNPEMESLFSSLESGDKTIVQKINDAWELNHANFKEINKIFKHDKIVFEIDGLIKWADKVPMKTEMLSGQALRNKSYRMVPGSWVRRGAYIGDAAVIMTGAFVNIGAYVGTGTMIDSGVTVGSCAHIGEKCHISSNTVIAGVLEPSVAMPVIIEKHVFIGAQCLIAEGVIVPEGCVVAAGVKLTSSTKIYDTHGTLLTKLEPYSVIVPGSYSKGNIAVDCAIVIKKVDKATRSKTNLNDILRPNE